jgi:hypothetical protein
LRQDTSIKAIGLLEPLVVYPEGENYVILDGAQRYRALLELGVEIVPCILGQRRETFTSDRMVNQVSPMQESRMIAKSLTELDEQTISATLGLGRIGHRIKKLLLQQLHPDVALAFDQGKIGRTCAQGAHLRQAPAVTGRAKPARRGGVKTSHFEARRKDSVSSGISPARGNEGLADVQSPRNGDDSFDYDITPAGLVTAADRPGTGY